MEEENFEPDTETMALTVITGEILPVPSDLPDDPMLEEGDPMPERKGKTGGIFSDWQSFEILPKKYAKGPWAYVSTRRGCHHAFAVEPYFGSERYQKANGVIVEQWVKQGRAVRSVHLDELFVFNCSCKSDEPESIMAYVAEKDCGCIAGLALYDEDNRDRVAVIVRRWVEMGYFINWQPISLINISSYCPHILPREMQSPLPGLGTADMEGVE